MRRGTVPFKFDLRAALAGVARIGDGRLSSVPLNLPFVSVRVQLTPDEKQVARQLLARIKDRRVLNSQECCDSCVDQALASLQEIRGMLVDAQVELSPRSDGPLSLMIELMSTAIRQFLTFEQRLTLEAPRGSPAGSPTSWDSLETYFDALELLRGHLSRCLGQMAVIADLDLPSDGLIRNYQGPWDLRAYVDPGLEP